MLTNLSLFSGAGGLDLGAKLVGGFKTVAYVEFDRYAQGSLCSRMREGTIDAAPIYEDVRVFDGRSLRGHVDVVSGGFPCQDVSNAGKRGGVKEGNRSGLWYQFARIIREVEPRGVLVENVGGLLSIDNGGGFGTVLRDLAALGYDAEWFMLSAADVGAPHLRERVWVVAHSISKSGQERGHDIADAGESGSRRDITRGSGADDWRESDSRQDDGMADASRTGLPGPRVGGGISPTPSSGPSAEFERGDNVADPEGDGRIERGAERTGQVGGVAPIGTSGSISDAQDAPYVRGNGIVRTTEKIGSGWSHFQDGAYGDGRWWATEPNVGRLVNGLAYRAHMLRCLGNGVVPKQSVKAWQRIKDLAEGT